MRTKKAYALAVVGAVIVAIVAAASATASTAQLVNDFPSYEAAAGESNRLTVFPSNSMSYGGGDPPLPVAFSDPGARVTAIGCWFFCWGCDSLSPTAAVCPLFSNVVSVLVSLDDQDDRFVSLLSAPVRTIVNGGSGDDQLTGGSGPDILRGVTGNDIINGGLGSDQINGQSGSEDTVDYSSRAADVWVWVDSFPDAEDGEVGELDTVKSDVENVLGGSGNDELRGDYVAANRLIGRAGNDLIYGFGGADILEGGGGNDTIYGDADDDVIFGGLGVDALDDGSGNDTIYSQDGDYDYIYCGAGIDTVYADAFDYFFGGCENVIS